MSTCDDTLTSPIHPIFTPGSQSTESSATRDLISKLNLLKHPEGGYFVETDRDPLRVPNPFQPDATSKDSLQRAKGSEDDSTRSASTTIFYLLTPSHPKGVFHRNKGRTMHVLHRGRGRYVILHADKVPKGGKARIETFVVGQNVHAGERLQWMVEGGKYKASFLLPDTEGATESEGLLISEVVVPGFEFSDHNFMPADELPQLVSREQSNELRWLLPARS